MTELNERRRQAVQCRLKGMGLKETAGLCGMSRHTVTNRGEMRWMVFKGALNSSIRITFLRRLARDSDRKVFLILDDLRVHHSKPV